MIPLICEDPAQAPASYTRFVLPFAYEPEQCSAPGLASVYKPSAPASVWRHNYLTVETAAVLLHRATWWELQGSEAIPPFPMVRAGRSIIVHVGTPRLVLFEWPTAIGTRNRDVADDPRCIGFLIIEVSFPKQEPAPSPDDLLAFNEAFRFWQLPYKGYERDFKELLADCPITLHQPNGVVGNKSPSPLYFFERWASLLQIPMQDDKGKTWRLFPETWTHEALQWVWTPEKRKKWRL